MKAVPVVSSLLSLMLWMGCADDQLNAALLWGDGLEGPVQLAAAHDLQDMASLSLFDDPTPPVADVIWPFVALFGPGGGQAAHRFFSLRAKLLTSEPELGRVHAGHQQWEGHIGRWLGCQSGKASHLPSTTYAPRLAAMHLGAHLWLMAQVHGGEASVDVGGQRHAIEDPRQGPLLLPAAYFDQRSVHTPARVRRWARQAVLLHEARHSDCSGGGLSDRAVDFIRSEKDQPRELEDRPDASCCWQHVRCRGGPADRQEACDRLPWGAYSVQLVFLRAIADQVPMSPAEASALQREIDEVRWHLQGFDVDEMLHGEMGAPDLSHTPRRRASIAAGAHLR